jgi:large subunit ribosomal protein L2
MTKFHIGLRKTGGRNNRGRITIRHRGGGHKRLYRPLNYPYLSGEIKRLEYDPNRTAYLAECQNGTKKFYKLLGNNQQIGQMIKVVKLKEVGIGEDVYYVSLRVGQLGKIGRSSGTSCQILKQGAKTTVIRMPSQQVKELNNENLCIIGSVISLPIERLEKAGRNR